MQYGVETKFTRHTMSVSNNVGYKTQNEEGQTEKIAFNVYRQSINQDLTSVSRSLCSVGYESRNASIVKERISEKRQKNAVISHKPILQSLKNA